MGQRRNSKYSPAAGALVLELSDKRHDGRWLGVVKINVNVCEEWGRVADNSMASFEAAVNFCNQSHLELSVLRRR